MILLDTNFLIRMLVQGTEAAVRVSDWIGEREQLCTSSICWYEFVTGPVDDHGVGLVVAALNNRIVPFTGDHAREAARLYNATGRQRRMRIDAMVAATAIVGNAMLVTENTDDFAPFVDYGLGLSD
jgi:predicted nucleic acid-binding protein